MTPVAELPPPAPAAKPRRRKPGRSVLLHNIEWETYEKILDAFGDRRSPRLTYDRGELEIMAPSNEHEIDAEILSDLIKILAEEMKFTLRPGGSFTMKRKDLKRGLEPDKCFWIASVPKLKGIRKLDLSIHPAPDLAVEVDVTNSSLDKFGIFAKLGVSELWRLDGDDLRFHRLGTEGSYVPIDTSLSFAGIAPIDLMVYVKQARNPVDVIPITQAFRAWVKQRIAVPSQPQ